MWLITNEFIVAVLYIFTVFMSDVLRPFIILVLYQNVQLLPTRKHFVLSYERNFYENG